MCVKTRRVARRLAACALLVFPASAGAQEPIGFAAGAFGRFDRDTLSPLAPSLALAEPHARPVFSPDGRRIAVGLSAPGDRTGRIGVWIVDPARMRVEHAVATGIAAEAVVYPGVVGAQLQDGRLVIIDPETGAIRSTRRVGWPACGPEAVHAAGRGVLVTAIRRSSSTVTIVEPAGALHRVTIPFGATGSCRRVGLAAGATRVYVTGPRAVAELDPRTRRVTVHRVPAGTSVATVPGGLAVAGARGLRVLDTRTWRTRWRDPTPRSVTASGNTVLGSGSEARAAVAARGAAGVIVARDAATGRLRWRSAGGVLAAVGGRVYTRDATLDLRTGARVGTYAPIYGGVGLLAEAARVGR
jgi:hypothetical protein